MVALGTIGELAVALSDLSHTRLIASTCRKSSVGDGEKVTLQQGAA
jgi:hypothetical protein